MTELNDTIRAELDEDSYRFYSPEALQASLNATYDSYFYRSLHLFLANQLRQYSADYQLSPEGMLNFFLFGIGLYYRENGETPPFDITAKALLRIPYYIMMAVPSRPVLLKERVMEIAREKYPYLFNQYDLDDRK